jgi:hypothetical protein
MLVRLKQLTSHISTGQWCDGFMTPELHHMMLNIRGVHWLRAASAHRYRSALAQFT